MYVGDCGANFFFSGCAKITAAHDRIRVAQKSAIGCFPKGLVANDKRDSCATEIRPSR
jgi:hypothetical protein